MRRYIVIMALTSTILFGCASTPQPDTTPVNNPNDRTVEGISSDTELETRIERLLAEASPAFDNLESSAHVNQGNVLLVGRIGDPQAIELANDLVLPLPGVESLHNHLIVGEKLTSTIKANDTWLRVRIHAAMFNADDFPSRKVEVIVENGVVYLMGSLTEDEGRQAAQLAAGVEGVQKVVTLFAI
ncbi:BON domain-containing protein [Salinibius halmophilus]|uniref:BON domain-containing protein n=1 Tax=Salinibius halmophilus TaxID=1853216 RepID=UPI001314DECA|nr:BON domain-containing protein [Salinibius halmophilus]